MEFYIEKHSSIPVVNQIQDQIKLAVVMGIFRTGDTLPSIRDVEKQTGVKRSQIHKAYSALMQSGLLVLIRGKGTVVAEAAASPNSVRDDCNKLADAILSKTRRMGISPIAFGKYLYQCAQERERNDPFIIYVDIHKETAEKMADKISQLWQVPVLGVVFQELKDGSRKITARQKILANQFMYEDIAALFPRKKSSVIAIDVRSSEQTVKILKRIKANSSVLYIHLPHPPYRIRFIISHLEKQLESRGVKVFSAPVHDMAGFRKLLKNSKYDYYLVGPAVRGEVPPEMRKNPCVLQINPQLDPASLEAARIRAGVVV
jgi:DNA-binding transcriptional regulator YhcF (GntR family)